MNKIPTQVNEGDLINSNTLIEPQEYYSDDKDKIVWALNKLFPHIKRWLDIEASDYRLTYYNPFESINSDINIKTHNGVVSLSVTPEINKPDIPDIPDVEEPEGEKPPRSMETSTGLQFTVEAKGAEITDTSFSVWVYGEIGQTIWELYKDDVLVVSPTVNTIGATIGRGMLYDMVTIPITDRAINNYTLKTLADRTCITAKSTFQGPNHIQSYVVTAFDNYASHPTFQLYQSSLQVPAKLPKHITSAESMFKYCEAFNQDITGWDVSNITNMDSMFQDCYLFDQPIGNWNVSNVTNMDYMFYGAKEFNQLIGSWNVANVTSMREMFRDALKFNKPLGNWNVSNVANMRGMFQDNNVFNQDISAWNTAKVTDMYRFLYRTYAFNQDLSQWCVPLITLEPSQFARDVVLWTLPKPVWGSCPRREDGSEPIPEVPLAPLEERAFRFTVTSPDTELSDTPFQLIIETPSNDWELYDENKTLISSVTVSTAAGVVDRSSGKIKITLGNLRGTTRHYFLVAKVASVRLLDGFNVSRSIDVTQFGDAGILSYNFSTFNAELTVPTQLPTHLTNLSRMFDSSDKFNQPLNSWNTTNVTNMEGMFAYATSFNQDISTWDVSNVTNMREMFYGATAFNQLIDIWDVSKVTTMTAMFSTCLNFNQPLSNWNVSNVTDMSNMFSHTQAFNQPLNSWNVGKVTNMQSMFYNALVFNYGISGWDVSSVTNMERMFSLAENFNKPLNNWNVKSVINMWGMFENNNVYNQDLSGWCVANITTKPTDFDTGTTSWVLAKPVWGTCPRGENVAA